MATQNVAAPNNGLVLMSVQDVADFLQIPRTSVYERTRRRGAGSNPIPCRRVGKYLRFFRHEVEAWLVALPQNKTRGQRRAA
jgi:predicted DNA-binding transcriptional regulator AlpA